jgi:hypothetical protein
VFIGIFAGDDLLLSRYVEDDLREIEEGVSGQCAALLLVDRMDAGASVVEITPEYGRNILELRGQFNMGDPELLSKFLTSALLTYPHAMKAIGIRGHGSGPLDDYDAERRTTWRGAPTLPRWRRSMRPASIRRGRHGSSDLGGERRKPIISADASSGEILTTFEMGRALETALHEAQAPQVDLIFFDSCLNGMIEVFEQVGKLGKIVIGSEDLVPGQGWDYQAWFEAMGQRPPATADAWARQALEAFEGFYAPKIALRPCTLGAFTTSNQITAAFKKVIEAAEAQGGKGFERLLEARNRTQSFAGLHSFDLKDFSARLNEVAKRENVNDLAVASEKLTQAIVGATAATPVKLGNEVRDSNGVAFYFPDNQVSYTQNEETYRLLKFDKVTGWSAYLAKRLP